MKHPTMKRWIGLQVLILLAVLTDITLQVAWRPVTRATISLAPVAIPMAYVSEYPECADELLRYNATMLKNVIPNDPLLAAWRAARAAANETHAGDVAQGQGPGP